MKLEVNLLHKSKIKMAKDLDDKSGVLIFSSFALKTRWYILLASFQN